MAETTTEIKEIGDKIVGLSLLQAKELSDYLNEKISLESVLVNSKEQNTQTNVSPDATNIWKNWNFLK